MRAQRTLGLTEGQIMHAMPPHHRRRTSLQNVADVCAALAALPDPKNLTEAESEVISLTAQLWNAYCALPSHHPAELVETQRDIHDVQNRIMARVTARAYPNLFTQAAIASATSPTLTAQQLIDSHRTGDHALASDAKAIGSTS